MSVINDCEKLTQLSSAQLQLERDTGLPKLGIASDSIPLPVGARIFLGHRKMMHRTLQSVAFCMLLFALWADPLASQQKNLVRNCSAEEIYEKLLSTDSEFLAKNNAIEKETQELYGLWATGQEHPPELPVIPVVVHIVYHADNEKLSLQQIQSQIEVLNRDFADHSDLSKIPERFRSLVGNPGIQFKLAMRDPSGKPTTGITYTFTSVPNFSDADADSVKRKDKGGEDPWPSDQYLNIWVCNLISSETKEPLLGYSSWPGQSAIKDGVVILNRVFGTVGVEKSDYDKGRTTTHEIGHWLGLHHLWGDGRDNRNCDRDDGIKDTPIQADKNYRCYSQPHITCNNGPKGDLFVDYMDYSPDSCMSMFTELQVQRMKAILSSVRKSLLISQTLKP